MGLGAKVTVIWLALAMAPAAIAQQGHGSGHEDHGATAWIELKAVRDSIAQVIESGKLAEVHEKSERLEPLGRALSDGAKSLPKDKRTRIEATLRQLPQLAGALHSAADSGNADATRRELKRLDGLLALIQAQYPADALAKLAAPGGMPAEHGPHVHKARPLAAVDEAPKATIRVKAGEFEFEPMSISMKAGEPTRIELENEGAIEHALIVAAPDGKGDWIHLHAAANSTDAETFRIDTPGTYPVLCTVQGHTEAGMVGELIVQ